MRLLILIFKREQILQIAQKFIKLKTELKFYENVKEEAEDQILRTRTLTLWLQRSCFTAALLYALKPILLSKKIVPNTILIAADSSYFELIYLLETTFIYVASIIYMVMDLMLVGFVIEIISHIKALKYALEYFNENSDGFNDSYVITTFGKCAYYHDHLVRYETLRI